MCVGVVRLYWALSREQGVEGTLVQSGSTAPNLLEPFQVVSVQRKEGV